MNSLAEGRTVWMREAKYTKIGYAAKGQRLGLVCKDVKEG